MYIPYGHVLAEVTGQAVEATDLAAELAGIWVCVAGLSVLGVWLWLFGGPGVLERAPVRRHRVPMWLPFAVFFVWLAAMVVLGGVVDAQFGEDQAEALRYTLTFVLNAVMIAGIAAAGQRFFARRLKGFGLNPRMLLRDAGWGAVNLTAVYPLVVAGMVLVTLAGRLWTGGEYEIPAHETLEQLMGFEQVWLRVLVIVMVTTTVPAMEELLFRGLMQSALQRVLPGRWPAIVMTSALFAVVHPQTHMLAIFALACGLGYAYERSGSLFRPIVMHMLFNGVSVAGALLVQQ